MILDFDQDWTDLVELVSMVERNRYFIGGRSSFVDRIDQDAGEASEIEALGSKQEP